MATPMRPDAVCLRFGRSNRISSQVITRFSTTSRAKIVGVIVRHSTSRSCAADFEAARQSFGLQDEVGIAYTKPEAVAADDDEYHRQVPDAAELSPLHKVDR